MKNIRIFLSENFSFLGVKLSMYLNRRVFVMNAHADWSLHYAHISEGTFSHAAAEKLTVHFIILLSHNNKQVLPIQREKGQKCQMRTLKAQISICIRASLFKWEQLRLRSVSIVRKGSSFRIYLIECLNNWKQPGTVYKCPSLNTFMACHPPELNVWSPVTIASLW